MTAIKRIAAALPGTAMTPAEIIAAALASREWRMRDLVTADGEAVRMILLSLDKMGKAIVDKDEVR